MIDSTNPRIMANAIRKLFSKVSAIPAVIGNPEGSGFNTLLTKIQIGSNKYKLPAEVTANPEGTSSGLLDKIKIGDSVLDIVPDYSATEFDTGKKWIDGSSIYGCFYAFEPALSVPASDTYVETNIPNSGINTIVSGSLYTGSQYKTMIPGVINNPTDGSYIRVINFRRTTAINVTGIYMEYTKEAPNDTRSIEPEVREEAPEEEPVIDEPIEEPVVEVKKTTRKKTTTE